MSVGHSPTPWNVFKAGKRYGIDAGLGISIVIYQANDERDGDGVLGRTKEEALANAAFIVRAVNAHDDLVAALKEAIEELEACCVALNGEGYNNPSFNAALAKAELP